MKRQFIALSLLATTTLAALGSFSFAQADTLFERERNNTDLAAQVLSPFAPGSATNPTFTKHEVKGTISNSDTDFYRFSLPNQGRLTFGFTPRRLIAVVFADLYLDENSNGQIEAFEKVDSLANSSSARTYEGLPPGRYFIKVVGSVRLLPSTPYTFTLQVTAGLRHEEVEPNDTPAQGTQVEGVVVGGRQVVGSVATDDVINGFKRDYYRFKLGTTVSFRLTVLSAEPEEFFNLYHDKNRDGRVSASEFLASRTTKTGNEALFFDFTDTNLPAGEYIIEVKKTGTARPSLSQYLLNLIAGAPN